MGFGFGFRVDVGCGAAGAEDGAVEGVGDEAAPDDGEEGETGEDRSNRYKHCPLREGGGLHPWVLGGRGAFEDGFAPAFNFAEGGEVGVEGRGGVGVGVGVGLSGGGGGFSGGGAGREVRDAAFVGGCDALGYFGGGGGGGRRGGFIFGSGRGSRGGLGVVLGRGVIVGVGCVVGRLIGGRGGIGGGDGGGVLPFDERG